MRGAKPKSSVWKYYDVVDKVATCKFCKVVSFKNNSTRIEIHLSACTKCPRSIATMFLVQSGTKKTALRTEEGLNRLKQLTANQETDNNELQKFSSFVDHMSQEQQELCERALSRAVIVTSSLRIFEHPLWRKALKALRPAFKIPSRQKIGGVLLDQEFEEVKLKVDNQIEEAERPSLQLDGWSNCRNEGITNILVTTPKPFFVESVEAKEDSQNSDFYVKCALRVFEKYDVNKFIAVVTDDGGPMPKFRSELKKLFAWLLEYPCGAHGIQLLIGDIMKLPTAKAISKSAKNVIKSIKRSHKLSATFARIQKDKKSLAIDPVVSKVLSNENREILLDNLFWDQLQIIFDLIEPMKKWITILESDQPRFHLVVKAFNEIKTSFNDKLTDSPLANNEIYLLSDNFKKRYVECVTDAHLADNYLHPIIQGEDLSNFQIDKVMEFLEEYSFQLGIFRNVRQKLMRLHGGRIFAVKQSYRRSP